VNGQLTRRAFCRWGMATAFSGLSFTASAAGRRSTRPGANDRIGLGFIGVGNRGRQLMDAFLHHDDVRVVALCDVDQTMLAKAVKKLSERVDTCKDFRRLLERKDIDAVVIATPDHWHAIQTVEACKAGKDVYVEKPLSITVQEGRIMVRAARKYGRVVQVGTQRRSSPPCRKLAERVQREEFGKICLARCYRISNMFPTGIGRARPTAPPPTLDWDLWLGPRPMRPYQPTIAPYKFRWWQLYSSQVANWGVHYLDAIRWYCGELAPASVCAMGGRFAVDDDRTIPDTMEVVFQFASGRLAIFGQYETSQTRAFPYGDVELRGTKATLYTSSNGYRVVPERGGQFQDPSPRAEPEEYHEPLSDADQAVLHTRNFLDCMRTRRQPNADIETGHRSTTFCLIANISLAIGQRLEWDPKAERFTNSDEANQMLHYEYRKPWKLQL